jgi:cyclopropane-fatty-acyl-phospholipid synthase
MDSLAIELCERGWFPDVLSRFGMRRLMAKRIADESAKHSEQQFKARIEELRRSRIANDTDAANEQHYELPAEFFSQVLGKHLKYSGCLWDTDVTDLDTAEARMLALTCERADLEDGQRILELGCGWGSLTLWMASHFPAAQITAVSNSASQREYIEAQCRARGLGNVTVITADVNEFQADGSFDRVVSVEMFEHMRNYSELMKNIHGWLRPGGKLFVHIFCHRELMYPFTTDGDNDWMGKYFFTGGLMPAENTLLHFQDHLKIEEQWSLSGTHYEKTSNAWLRNMDNNEDAVMDALTRAYGPDQAGRWFQRWRMFFMAVAELFGYDGGSEWRIAHYRFRRPE